MDNIKNDEYYLTKIIEYIDFAINSVSKATREEFNNNEILINAIMFSFIQISEYSNKLSSDYKLSKKDVPWNKIKGIRNVIVHDYDIVDTEIVYTTVINDFPSFKDKIKNS